MDTGEGRFKSFMLDSEETNDLQKRMSEMHKEFPKHGGTFTVGEEIEIKGSLFKVKSIKPTGLRLKLLKRK